MTKIMKSSVRTWLLKIVSTLKFTKQCLKLNFKWIQSSALRHVDIFWSAGFKRRLYPLPWWFITAFIHSCTCSVQSTVFVHSNSAQLLRKRKLLQRLQILVTQLGLFLNSVCWSSALNLQLRCFGKVFTDVVHVRQICPFSVRHQQKPLV